MPGTRTNLLTEWGWAVTLWLFRLFCLAWVAVVVMLAAKAVATFFQR